MSSAMWPCRPDYEKKIKANRKAWSFWQKLAPSYKKQSTWWVMSAKKEETRQRRLDILIKQFGCGGKNSTAEYRKTT